MTDRNEIYTPKVSFTHKTKIVDWKAKDGLVVISSQAVCAQIEKLATSNLTTTLEIDPEFLHTNR